MHKGGKERRKMDKQCLMILVMFFLCRCCMFYNELQQLHQFNNHQILLILVLFFLVVFSLNHAFFLNVHEMSERDALACS